MKTTKTKRIQKNSIVRIVTPDLFVRCGYPISPKSPEVQEHIKKWTPQLEQILEEIAPSSNKEAEYVFQLTKTPKQVHRAIQSFLKEAAYLYCKSKGFGGNTRAIFTNTVPDLKGKLFKVTGAKGCYTGEREPGYTSYSYEGDHEYVDGYLKNSKYHHILDIFPLSTDDDKVLPHELQFYKEWTGFAPQPQIEDVNVELVNESDPDYPY